MSFQMLKTATDAVLGTQVFAFIAIFTIVFLAISIIFNVLNHLNKSVPQLETFETVFQKISVFFFIFELIYLTGILFFPAEGVSYAFALFFGISINIHLFIILTVLLGLSTFYESIKEIIFASKTAPTVTPLNTI